MNYSIRSIRKRLLECLTLTELVALCPDWDKAAHRGRSTVIEYVLDHWTIDCDTAIQKVVDKAKETVS